MESVSIPQMCVKSQNAELNSGDGEFHFFTNCALSILYSILYFVYSRCARVCVRNAHLIHDVAPLSIHGFSLQVHFCQLSKCICFFCSLIVFIYFFFFLHE